MYNYVKAKNDINQTDASTLPSLDTSTCISDLYTNYNYVYKHSLRNGDIIYKFHSSESFPS